MEGGGAYCLMHFFKTTVSCIIYIRVVLKRGQGGPPRENFDRNRCKIGQF